MKYLFTSFLLFISFFNHPVMSEELVNSGKIIFSQVPQLPENWWTEPELNSWEPDTYYLWGANPKNYDINDPTLDLRGSGMASANGPTRGRGHSNYIGVITTAISKKTNNAIFTTIEKKLLEGSNIVIPVLNGRFGLGTGVAYQRHTSIENWYRSQKYLFEKILHLSSVAKEVVFEEGIYWPDCGVTMQSDSPTKFPIKSVDDIKNLIPYLNKRIELSKAERGQIELS